MASAAVSNRSPLDAILLGYEQEAGKVDLREHGVGRQSGIIGLLSNEELDIHKSEGVMGGIGTALVVFI